MYHEWVDLHFQSATFHRAGHFTAKLTFCNLKLILASWAVNLNPLSRFNSGGKDWSILECKMPKQKIAPPLSHETFQVEIVLIVVLILPLVLKQLLQRN